MLEYHRHVIRGNGPEVKMIFSARRHSRFPSLFLQGLHQAFCIDGTVRKFHWILDRPVELWERWGEVVVAQHMCPRGCGLRVEVQPVRDADLVASRVDDVVASVDERTILVKAYRGEQTVAVLDTPHQP